MTHTLFASPPRGVKFFDIPSQRPDVPPFIGVRFVDAEGEECAPSVLGIAHKRVAALRHLLSDVWGAALWDDLRQQGLGCEATPARLRDYRVAEEVCYRETAKLEEEGLQP